MSIQYNLIVNNLINNIIYIREMTNANLSLNLLNSAFNNVDLPQPDGPETIRDKEDMIMTSLH